MEIFKRITGWLETGVIVVCYVSPFRRVRVDFDLLVQEGARALMQFLSLCSGAGWRSSSSGHHPQLAPSPHRDLPHAIDKLDPATLVPFPQFDGSRFREILDEEMGFSHSRENSAGR